MNLSYCVYFTLSNKDSYYTKVFDKEGDAYLYIKKLLKENDVKEVSLIERKERYIDIDILRKRHSND